MLFAGMSYREGDGRERSDRDMKKVLEMNKVYTWDEISSTYPDMYAIITDIERKDGAIVRCRLLDICTFEDESKYIEKYLKEGIRFGSERTTFLAPTMGTLL